MKCEVCELELRRAFLRGERGAMQVFYAPGREHVLCKWCVRRLLGKLPTTKAGQVVWWARLFREVLA